MNIELRKSSVNILLSVQGDIIFEECKKFKESIIPRLDSTSKILYINLNKVAFIDSAGLGVLVGLKMTCKKNNTNIVLLNPSAQVLDILSVAKLDNIFDIVSGPEADEVLDMAFKESNVLFEEKKEPEKFTIKKIITKEKIPTKEELLPHSEAKTTVEPEEAIKKESLEDEADKLCQQAMELLKEKKIEKALDNYLKVIELNPDHISAHNNLAIIYERNPLWKEKAIDEWEIVLNLGKSQKSQKHIERATEHLEKLKGE